MHFAYAVNVDMNILVFIEHQYDVMSALIVKRSILMDLLSV